MQYLRSFDIILLTETRVDNVADNIFPDHSIAFSPARQAGQAGEGMTIAVRKFHAYHLQDWTSDDTSLWVKLIFPSGAAPLIVGTCYMPPQASQNLRVEDAPSRFGKLAAHFLAAQGEGLVLLAGDFNARVGHLELPNCAMRAGPADSAVNAHGRQLINLCTSTGALLCTGWTPGDEAAPFSFRHHNGGRSRIDHVLISPQLRDAMRSCAVTRSRTESDHSPIECQLQLRIGVVCATVCNGVSLTRRYWNADCRNTYYDALQAPQCVAELQAASQAASLVDVTSSFHHLSHGVGLAAGASNMPARGVPHKQRIAPHQPFFDAECQALKRVVRRTQDPVARKQLEREYHSLVRSKRRAHRLGRLRAFITLWQSNTHSRAAFGNTSARNMCHCRYACRMYSIGRHTLKNLPMWARWL